MKSATLDMIIELKNRTFSHGIIKIFFYDICIQYTKFFQNRLLSSLGLSHCYSCRRKCIRQTYPKLWSSLYQLRSPVPRCKLKKFETEDNQYSSEKIQSKIIQTVLNIYCQRTKPRKIHHNFFPPLCIYHGHVIFPVNLLMKTDKF